MADDAKPTNDFSDFDERGTLCVSVNLKFGGPKLDPKLLSERGAKVETIDEGATWWASFSLLPEPLVKGATYVQCTVHSHGPEFDETHWEVSFVRVRDPEKRSTPKTIEDQRLRGAFPENFAELLELANLKPEVDASARAYYLTDDKNVSIMFPTAHPGLVSGSPGECELRVRSVSWEISGTPTLNQVSVEISDYDNASWIVLRGETHVTLKPDVKIDLDFLLWDEVMTCLPPADT